MSTTKPTAKEINQLATCVVKGMNQSDAFRKVFPNVKYKDSSIHCEASKLFSKPKVIQRIEELKIKFAEKAEEKALYTLEEAVKDLTRAMDRADELGQTSTIVSAVMGKAKLMGMLVDKVENQNQEPKINIILNN